MNIWKSVIHWLTTIWQRIVRKNPQHHIEIVEHVNSGNQQNVTNIFNITDTTFHVYKEITPEAILNAFSKLNIPPSYADPTHIHLDASTTPQELMFNIGAITGSTATASGIPFDKVKDAIAHELANKSWKCPHCGYINPYTQSNICARCHKGR